MDDTPKVRRFGASRFGFSKPQSIKQSGFECGENKQGIKSKRTVSREEGEMDSDEEQQLPPTTNNRKRFKFSKKFLDECNNVDHASIPRKIRSAVKKRSGGSLSPPLPDMKKVKHTANGNVFPRKYGTKKSKLIMQNGELERSPKQFDSLPITPDEEEVVETLFALAGMFSNNDQIDETNISRLDCTLSEAKTPSDMAECSTHSSEVLKQEGDLQTNDSPCLKGSTISAHETYSQEKNPIVLDSLEIPHPNVARMLEPKGERQTCKFDGAPMIDHDRSSFPASELKLDIAMELVQSELQPAITRENKLGGSALWPDLSKMRFLDAKKQGPSLQLCAGKLPAWTDSSAKLCSSSNVEVGEKKKNEWKRCSAHVYISRVIKALQVTEGKECKGVNWDELKRKQGSKDEAVLASNNNIYSNACEKTSNGDSVRWSNEVWNGDMALEKKLVQDEYQKQYPSISYTPSSSQNKQPSMNLITMSSEDYGRAEKRSKASYNVPPPYLHYIAQNQARFPQHNGYSSSHFPHDLLGLQQQQQQQQVCMESMQQLQVQRMMMDKYNRSRGIEASAGVYYFAPTTNYAVVSMLPQSQEAKRHHRPCVDQGKAAPRPLHFTYQSPQLPLPSV